MACQPSSADESLTGFFGNATTISSPEAEIVSGQPPKGLSGSALYGDSITCALIAASGPNAAELLAELIGGLHAR